MLSTSTPITETMMTMTQQATVQPQGHLGGIQKFMERMILRGFNSVIKSGEMLCESVL